MEKTNSRGERKMKLKLLAGLVFAILLSSTAMAYSTVISIGVKEMACASCDSCGAGGISLTSLTGTGGIACVSTSGGCACISGTSNSIGTSISEGSTYSTGTVNLTKGTKYFACLKLTESTSGSATDLISSCSGSPTSANYFSFGGSCTCGGYARGYVTPALTQNTIWFAFVILG
jgi:hypothetical protein